MPAVSKKQFRFFSSVASGLRKVKGLTRTAAKEAIAGQTLKGLPARAQTNKKKKRGKK